MTKKVVMFVGAGISRSAGIPTYRDEEGLWSMNDMRSICTKGREYDAKSYDFYNRFRELLKSVRPSEVHYALRDIQNSLGYERCKIYSQNIDDLLERAGCKVEKVHGNACESRCDHCGRIVWIDYGKIEFGNRCVDCGNRLRNNIVYYGERGNYENLISDIVDLESEDMLFIIGTSNASINIDRIIHPLKMKKIYVNMCKEERYDINQYDHVIIDRIELCLDRIKDMIRH